MRKLFSGILLFPVMFVLFGCNSEETLKPYKTTRFALGTVIEITVLDDSESHANAAINAAMAEINRIGALFYEGNPESPLYQFSQPTCDRVVMPAEVLNLIQRGLKISELTGGGFDMTVGALLKLWDFKSENPTLPTEEQIKAVLPFVGYHKLSIDLDKKLLIASSPLTMLTTGGIAKGYAVDRAIEILAHRRVKGALVNAGGDLRVLPRTDRKKWRVGIQDPRNRNDLLMVIELDSGAVVTSGDYQKYFMINEKRYHHILNPKTGYPADSCQSVTVVAPSAEMADALATGMFVAGPQKGLDILTNFPSIAVLIIRSDGKIIRSANWDNLVKQSEVKK